MMTEFLSEEATSKALAEIKARGGDDTDYIVGCLVKAREGDKELFTQHVPVPGKRRIGVRLYRMAIIPLEEYEELKSKKRNAADVPPGSSHPL